MDLSRMKVAPRGHAKDQQRRKTSYFFLYSNQINSQKYDTDKKNKKKTSHNVKRSKSGNDTPQL